MRMVKCYSESRQQNPSQNCFKHNNHVALHSHTTMDNSPDTMSPDLFASYTSTSEGLSYDDTIPYEEQIPTEDEKGAAEAASLAKRIGTAKVYLLSDTSVARVGKVR